MKWWSLDSQSYVTIYLPVLSTILNFKLEILRILEIVLLYVIWCIIALCEDVAESHFQTRKIIGQQYKNFYRISAVDLQNTRNKNETIQKYKSDWWNLFRLAKP